ncbi:hypothetical protein [Nostoc sp. NMS9]|uniref:hypothetical protein n=1 Tax=Nostoc sp. NMS9 TaxID=2815393 RepID=UPI0025EE54E5|nr:hypothetical protein [Nostoc sp. NMS9]MBN3940664.1 hypothetical protein [Nostoc sp. NMS9]
MMKKFHKTVVIFATVAALTSGCNSRERYKQLAEVGNKYSQAVDQLLITAGNIKIDKTSEEILDKKRRYNSVSSTDYYEKSKLDNERLHIINELRNHNQLLEAYFSKLQELASSDAPNEAKTAIAGIADNLNNSGASLQRIQSVIVSPIAIIVLDSQIHGALKEELKQRKEAIIKQLTIQEKLLQFLSEDIQEDVNRIQELQEQRLVIQPLTQLQPIADEEQWIAERSNILTMNIKIEGLVRASNTLKEFKQTFQDSLEGKTSVTHLNSVLKDIDSFLMLVATIK